jgi:acyl-CoA synthetase (AMP-forming)/AMP-acid ligase II
VVLRRPVPVRALTEHCRGALAADKTPARFFSLRRLPRNDNGKLLRPGLEQLVKARAGAAKAGDARR